MKVGKFSTQAVLTKKGIAKLWLDFRIGYGTYATFGYALMNFMLLAYVASEKTTLIRNVFGSPYIFMVVVILSFTLVSLFFGYFHRKTQVKVEQEATRINDPTGMVCNLYSLRLMKGMTTPREDAVFARYYNSGILQANTDYFAFIEEWEKKLPALSLSLDKDFKGLMRLKDIN